MNRIILPNAVKADLGSVGPVLPIGFGWNRFRNVGTGLYERWQCAGLVTSGDFSAGFATAGQIYSVPHVFATNGTIDKISIQVTAVNTGINARVGIYENGPDTVLYPTNLLYDSGNIDITTTGVKSVTTTFDFLANKLYWFCTQASATTTPPNLKTMARGSWWNAWGISTTFNNGNNGTLITPFAFAAYPSTFPAGGAPNAADMHVIALRFSA